MKTMPSHSMIVQEIFSGSGTKKQGESTYYGQYVDDQTQLHQHLDIMDSSGGWISSVFDLVRFLVHFDGGGVKTDLIKGSQYDIMVEPSEVDPNPYKFAKGLMFTLALSSRTYHQSHYRTSPIISRGFYFFTTFFTVADIIERLILQSS